MSDYLSTTLLTKKKEIDCVIRDAIDKVLVLRFGRASDPVCLHLDDILSKSAREVSKFATIALVDIDSEDVQVYVNYFDITLVPSTVFFFNAHHMKMDSGTADHTKWVGAFHRKQDFIDVVESLLIDGRLFSSIETLRNKCSDTEETYIMKLQWRQRTSPQTWLLSSYTAIAPCPLQCAVFIFMSVQVLLQLVTHETGFVFQK
eukprot:XP_024450636.1 thioredoxin-like protein 4B isoform X2 [Populus trichocarpa]